MGGLMYKNFLIYRVELAVAAVLQLFVSGAVLLTALAGTCSPQGNLLLYGCVFLITGFMKNGLFAPDEKQPVRSFLTAAPTGAKGHVESKYNMLLLVNLAALACCLLTDAVAYGLTGDRNAVTGRPLLLLIGLALGLEAIVLPFIVYYGSECGMAVMGSALGVLVLLALVYALFGDISYFLSHDFMTALRLLLTKESMIRVMSVLPFGGALLYWLSCRLSVALFRRSAEKWD